LALTERENQILRLKKTICRIMRLPESSKLMLEMSLARLTALRKIERAQADLDFAIQVGAKINFNS
jgi:hypothetical protein